MAPLPRMCLTPQTLQPPKTPTAHPPRVPVAFAEVHGQGRVFHGGAVPLGGVAQPVEVLQPGEDRVDASN